MYNDFYIFKVSRLEYLDIKQGYYDNDLEYTFYLYKCRSKTVKKWIKKYECRRSYYSSFYHDDVSDLDFDYLPYIKLLF